MDGWPGVSVIIPIYNMEPYLDRCLASVTGQTYRELEIILVNDGSYDRSLDICLHWSRRDSRIRCFSQDNAGLGMARNSGLNAAGFQYVTFLDADDWLDTSFVEKIMACMLREDADVGLCDIMYVDSATMHCQPAKIRLQEQVAVPRENRSVVNKARLFAWGKIYRKELFLNHHILYPALTYEDTAATPLLIALANKVCCIQEPLYFYFRNRSGSLSNNEKNIDDIGDTLRLLYDRLNALGIYDAFAAEFKKILLGQVRFALRKWHKGGSPSVLSALDKLGSLVKTYFPGIENYAQSRYFTGGDPMLTAAADKAFPLEAQWTDDIHTADYVIAFDTGRTDEAPGKKRIVIPKPPSFPSGDESSLYDIAEIIMEQM